MERHGFLVVFLLLYIVADVSKANLLTKRRFLIGEPPKDNSTVPGKDFPVPSPPPPPVSNSSGNGSDPKPIDDASKNKTGSPVVDGASKNKTDSPPPGKTPKADPGPKGVNNDNKTGPVSPPTDAGDGKNHETHKKDSVPEKPPKEDPKAKPSNDEPGSASPPPEDVTGKSQEKVEKKDDNVTHSTNANNETCDGVIEICRDLKDIVACIKSYDSGSKEAVVLVQNIGDSTLKANLSAENTKKEIEIPKHQTEKIKISLDVGKSTKVSLKAGNRECVLQTGAFVSEGNFFLHLPSFDKIVTPINSAYFLIVTVLIFGGTWTLCMVRKRKQRSGGGIPYQELEMGLPESVAATEVVTAEGWDQGWDDDWDGDNAVKSPGGHIVGSISANGLTSRSSNKDGWENDWDE